MYSDDRDRGSRTITVREAAGLFGVGINQAYAAVRAGEIPAIRIGGSWKVLADPVDRILSGDAPKHEAEISNQN